MIPRICANCASGTNVTDGQAVMGCVCKATPWTLWKAPDDFCMKFSMDNNPAYVIQGQGEPLSREMVDEHEETPMEAEEGGETA